MIEKTICVVDHGLFVELALRLSRDFARVLYHTPQGSGFPKLCDHVVGDGFEEIERINCIWEHIDEIDCFAFPDIGMAGLQTHLEKSGHPVWGSRTGDSLEIQRGKFLDTVRECNLPVAGHFNVRGLEELRKALRERQDKFIKLSRYRGDMETWHHVDYATSEPMLDSLALKFGPLQNHVPFLVCDSIDTDVEVGYDGYCIDGKFPSVGIHGIECKDQSLIASVLSYDQLPEQVKEVNNAMAPVLATHKYRNFWSTEIRVKDSLPYFIDPTCRMPSPSGEIQLELYNNLGDIIWNGANGQLVEPELTGKFGAEVILQHNGDCEHWRTLEIPDEVRQWVKLYHCCKTDGRYHVPPVPHLKESIGAVIGIGDTMEEAIDHLKENVEAIKNQPVTANIESLYKVLEEAQSAEDQGMKFSNEEIPEPETAMEKT